MSVIGRLDEQTDAVLISPLAKKREREEKVASESTTPHRAGETALPKGETTPEQKETLPVWLL